MRHAIDTKHYKKRQRSICPISCGVSHGYTTRNTPTTTAFPQVLFIDFGTDRATERCTSIFQMPYNTPTRYDKEPFKFCFSIHSVGYY